MKRVVRIGIIKLGCIGALPLLEFLLDERADRTDIDVRVIGSGAKLGLAQCSDVTNLMIEQRPDIVILVGPAQTAPGPSEARKMLKSVEMPTIVISDGPAEKLAKKDEDSGVGYIIVKADSMIGARREFLDPVEMAVYNSDVIRVLAETGAFNLIISTLESVIESLRTGEKPDLPRLVIDGYKAVEAAGFSNPYAKAKALAAYESAGQVSSINVKACFGVSDPDVYVPLVATAHEMMRAAAKLADKAREIEKKGDMVLRKPHFKDGTLGIKRSLMKKPERSD